MAPSPPPLISLPTLAGWPWAGHLGSLKCLSTCVHRWARVVLLFNPFLFCLNRRKLKKWDLRELRIRTNEVELSRGNISTLWTALSHLRSSLDSPDPGAPDYLQTMVSEALPACCVWLLKLGPSSKGITPSEAADPVERNSAGAGGEDGAVRCPAGMRGCWVKAEDMFYFPLVSSRPRSGRLLRLGSPLSYLVLSQSPSDSFRCPSSAKDGEARQKSGPASRLLAEPRTGEPSLMPVLSWGGAAEPASPLCTVTTAARQGWERETERGEAEQRQGLPMFLHASLSLAAPTRWLPPDSCPAVCCFPAPGEGQDLAWPSWEWHLIPPVFDRGLWAFSLRYVENTILPVSLCNTARAAHLRVDRVFCGICA